jgi:hypothetical protein
MKGMTVLLAWIAVGATAAGAAPASIDAMRWHRRILVVASPAADDPRAQAQRRIVAGWTGADDRDVSLVEVSGARVTGAGDTASSLVKRYRLRPGRFQVLLIGKDGTVALRSGRPVSAQRLQGTIDAMPMRRDGGR